MGASEEVEEEEGFVEGSPLGSSDGSNDRREEGLVLGTLLGGSDGTEEGTTLGKLVGSSVNQVGAVVGANSHSGHALLSKSKLHCEHACWAQSWSQEI